MFLHIQIACGTCASACSHARACACVCACARACTIRTSLHKCEPARSTCSELRDIQQRGLETCNEVARRHSTKLVWRHATKGLGDVQKEGRWRTTQWLNVSEPLRCMSPSPFVESVRTPLLNVSEPLCRMSPSPFVECLRAHSLNVSKPLRCISPIPFVACLRALVWLALFDLACMACIA